MLEKYSMPDRCAAKDMIEVSYNTIYSYRYIYAYVQ
jgi:hypothetical protein